MKNALRSCVFFIAKAILRLLFRVEVRGIEHYHAAGDRVLILPNHISILDPALVALFVPNEPIFAINLFVAQTWTWLKPILKLVRTWPIDPTNPFALKGLVKELRKGGICVFFPEGRISTTGGLMKIYDGAAMLADKTGATLLPLRIDGAEFSKFSYLEGKFPLRFFPKITLTFLPPRTLSVSSDLRGRRRSQAVQVFLYDLMRDSAFLAMNNRHTLFQAVLHARALYGNKRVIAMDTSRKPVTYDKLVMGSLAIGKHLTQETHAGDRVGIFLPGSVATLVAIFGLLIQRRVPAMLNYTSGIKNILACCTTGSIKKVITSHRFVEAGKFEDILNALESAGIKIVWLEEVATKISPMDKLLAFIRSKWMRPSYFAGNPDSAALVLFTSGSEGTPKGVVLSHANVISSRNQLLASMDFAPSDVVMNAMPMFHMFGLVVGTLMPLLTGIKSFYYPTPLHYRIIPLVIYDISATIIFGTDTFLYAYGRAANAYDFYSVRYAFAGAEKLRDHTRNLWGEKFGIRIIEGYGATETSIISLNTPLQFRVGTVGRLMPSIEYRLTPVPGIDKGGRLYVKGPNVMLGYLIAGQDSLQSLENGWYDTGDIIDIDSLGFLTIRGRAKRFAKIGGEMISLTAIEEELDQLWTGIPHAVVSQQDPRRGEVLLLVTEKEEASREELTEFLRGRGHTDLAIPKRILCVKKIPLLGSGKINYPAIQELLQESK